MPGERRIGDDDVRRAFWTVAGYPPVQIGILVERVSLGHAGVAVPGQKHRRFGDLHESFRDLDQEHRILA